MSGSAPSENRGTVVALCNRTQNIVQPWLDAGFKVITVDMQEASGSHENRTHIVGDVTALSVEWIRDLKPVMVFAFPPCTDLAVSGSRHFQRKGMARLIEALRIVEACRALCEASGARYLIENPVSTLSSYWRKPNYIFNPCDFTGYEPDDNYTKKTCLWTDEKFVMPAPFRDPSLGDPDDRIHKMPPSEDRADKRSMTPRGFARALFLANRDMASEAILPEAANSNHRNLILAAATI